MSLNRYLELQANVKCPYPARVSPEKIVVRTQRVSNLNPKTDA
jgi:hypothetical protein